MKNTEEMSIQELIDTETDARLNEMAQSDYEFPRRITKSDVIAMLISVAASIALIALCMTGVIK